MVNIVKRFQTTFEAFFDNDAGRRNTASFN